MDYLEKFQKLIEEYNSGSMNIEKLFEELKNISALLNEEEKRAVKNELTEEELAIFDLLTKPEPKLTEKEEKQVKSVSKRLVQVIESLGLRDGWKGRQQVRADIKVNIEKAMDEGLPEVYDRTLFARKSESVYQYVFEIY